jgi:hypothetical protein
MLSALVLDAYAPPLEPATSRAENAVRALEETWPIHLVNELDLEGNRIRHDHDRPAYLASKPQGLAFIASLDDEPHATLSGLVLEGGILAPVGVDELHVLGHLPAIDSARAARGLERFAEALAATSAMLTPTAAHDVIMEQVTAPTSDDQPPAGLPRLDVGEDLEPAVPRCLGWINYWNDAAATRIGFTGKAADVFASVRRVATGWVAQLTAEPLDLERPDHLAVLRRAYDRFPAIGRRG